MDIHPCRRNEILDYYRIWNSCFGDSFDTIIEFLKSFQKSVLAYTLTDQEDVRAALTTFFMGNLKLPKTEVQVSRKPGQYPQEDLPVNISYAIGTDPDHRGSGYGSAITAFAAEKQTEAGFLSVLSPADQGLVNFYKPLGYVPYFYKEELTADAVPLPENSDSDAVPEVLPLPAKDYFSLREGFLADRPHIALSKETLDYEALCAVPKDEPYDGYTLTSSGFFRCYSPVSCVFTVEPSEPGQLYIPELVTQNDYSRDEITALLASLASMFGKETAFCMTPAAPDSTTALVHGMLYIPDHADPSSAAGSADDPGENNKTPAENTCSPAAIAAAAPSGLPPWLGFAFD